MAKRTRKQVVEDRWEGKQRVGKQIQDKYKDRRQEDRELKPLVPMNEKQKEYIKLLKTKDMVLCTGLAGSSKTFVPTTLACDWYREGIIDKIVFTRPPISNSKPLGFYGGGLVEKMSNWLMSVLPILNERLGVNVVELAIKRGDIEFVPLEVIKGYSAKNCVFICDEAEDITIEEAKKIVTRQGQNCKMVLTGDCSQSELKERSGLKYLIDMARKHTLDVGIMDFNSIEDIVRSDQCREWLIAFTKEENE